MPVDADDSFDPDDAVNIRMWLIQVIVWCMCTLLAKILVFFFQFAYHKSLVAWGDAILSVFHGHPNIELVIVMIIVPVTMNSLMFWVQDAFLKGDKHLDARRAMQEAMKRKQRLEMRERMYNMGKGNAEVEAAREQLEQEESEDEFGNVVIKKRINRQIEEGVYNMDNDEFVPIGEAGPRYRKSSIVEMHNDLDKVDEDEFDRIIE